MQDMHTFISTLTCLTSLKQLCLGVRLCGEEATPQKVYDAVLHDLLSAVVTQFPSLGVLVRTACCQLQEHLKAVQRVINSSQGDAYETVVGGEAVVRRLNAVWNDLC